MSVELCGKPIDIDIDIVVDFLMPKDAVIARNKPPLVDDFVVQRADGADLGLLFSTYIAVAGECLVAE